MTETNKRTTAESNPTSAPAETGTPSGVLQHLDPHSVVLEGNVRTAASASKEFVQSIRDHGVMVPVYGRRDAEGRVIVRAGQRRVLGAREAGAATIPVYILEGGDDVAERIIEQLIENEHRDVLPQANLVAAWKQLAFEGLGVAAIARKTGTKPARVKQGLAVAESAAARSAVTEHQLDLEQAATLVEFEDDPEAVAELIEIASQRPDQFGHAAQRARDRKDRETSIATAKAHASAAGFIVLEREPAYGDRTWTRTDELVAPDGEPVTVVQLAGKTGVAVSVTADWDGELRLTYWVDEPASHGFRRRRPDGTAPTPMSDEEKNARRELIANNKAWDSAEKVRREWLTKLLSRKTPPKDASAFVAEALTARWAAVAHAMSLGNEIAHTLLGIEHRAPLGEPDRLAALLETQPHKAVHIALAVVLGGIEHSTGRHTWRRPQRTDAAYLTRLAGWGYTLSDVEQLVVDSAAPKDQ